MPPRFPSKTRTPIFALSSLPSWALRFSLPSAERLRWPPAIGPNSGSRRRAGDLIRHEQILNTNECGRTHRCFGRHKTARFHSPPPAVVDGVAIAGRMLSTPQPASSYGPRIRAGSLRLSAMVAVYMNTQDGSAPYVAANGTNLCGAREQLLAGRTFGSSRRRRHCVFRSALGSVFAIDAATGAPTLVAPISSDNAASCGGGGQWRRLYQRRQSFSPSTRRPVHSSGLRRSRR